MELILIDINGCVCVYIRSLYLSHSGEDNKEDKKKKTENEKQFEFHYFLSEQQPAPLPPGKTTDKRRS